MKAKKNEDIFIAKNKKLNNEKSKYSDEELNDFRTILQRKLEEANKELENLHERFKNINENGTDDTARSFKIFEDGSDTLLKEEISQLVYRQNRYISELKNALKRVDAKTYGICRITGKLIQKERLRIVPHTTLSIEAQIKEQDSNSFPKS